MGKAVGEKSSMCIRLSVHPTHGLFDYTMSTHPPFHPKDLFVSLFHEGDFLLSTS